MASRYGSMTVNQLTEELRKQNAKVAGRKADLVERLEAYDRNKNFGNEKLQPEFNMKLPSASLYKDLHSDMVIPCVSPAHVNCYLEACNSRMDKKALALYNAHHLNFVRVAADGGLTFIRAEVRAEMKMNVVYTVDCMVSADSVIHECQCECAAGMGPTSHCKHVRCVLFGVTEFAAKGSVQTKATCIQQLQTFHQTRRHLESPVKAEHLQLGRKRQSDLDFDPRPPTFREVPAYPSYFFNTLINGQDNMDSPIMQAIPPANLYAVVKDHDYAGSNEEHFLVALELSHLSEKRRDEIQQLTRENKKAWKEERRKRLCSSEFGRLAKLTEKTDKHKLASSLMNDNDVRSAAIMYGRKYELTALKKYEAVSGNTTQPCGLFVCKVHPFLASTPDGVVSHDHFVEVKCPKSAFEKLISPDTVPYLEDSDGSGSLNLKQSHDYFFQVQGQMMCTGAKQVDFVVFTSSDCVVIPILRDDTFIGDMKAKLISFYEQYFKPAVLEKYLYKH